MRYRAKPLEIDAVLWTGDWDALPVEWQINPRVTRSENGEVILRTVQGPAIATAGEFYLVDNPDFRETYPVPVAIFERRYEVVDE